MSKNRITIEEIEESLYRFQEKYETKKNEEVYGIVGEFLIDEEDSSTVINKTDDNNLH